MTTSTSTTPDIHTHNLGLSPFPSLSTHIYVPPQGKTENEKKRQQTAQRKAKQDKTRDERKREEEEKKV
jgi:hypothetical protein